MNHDISSVMRKRVFEAVRDYPGLCATELATLLEVTMEGGITTHLTQLFDKNLVTRTKKTIVNDPSASHATRTVYHYTTAVAEYRWERKTRVGGKRKPRPEAAKWSATTATTPMPVAPVPIVAPIINGHTSDRIEHLISTIQDLPYRDVIRLRTKLQEMFA